MERIDPRIEDSWKAILMDEFRKDYFVSLKQFLVEEKARHIVYPAGNNIFNAFNLTPFESVKVVILGQDPYHGPGQAHGLCFSVQEGIPQPPSLQNIFKEISSDLGISAPKHGNLEAWARQGVLLMNAILTVRAGVAGSHQNKGWELFTNEVISQISKRCDGIVFMLWGNYARAKTNLIDNSRHYILEAAHPSPLSASKGFLGCRHFSQANAILIKEGKDPIDWRL